mgnify:CR=1 FL=1
MKIVYAILLIVTFVGTALLFVRNTSAAASGESANGATFEQRFPNLPKDALKRRERSNVIMRAEGVPLNEWLPTVESENEVILPSTEQVAMRAAATIVVALKGQDTPQTEIDELVSKYELADWFSPDEAKFIADSNPTERERQIQAWRFEAANALLWSLGYVARMDGPRSEVDPGKIAAIVLRRTRAQFIADAKLRSKSEILDQVDLIYRYRWALVDASLHKQAPPSGLSDDIAMERHQVFNWLIEHATTEWDDISLDT